MRTRAYRPEVDGLENRAMLSGIAGHPGHPGHPKHPGHPAKPAVLPIHRLIKVFTQTDQVFLLYGMGRFDADGVREDLYNVAVIIPYGRMDGLGVKINQIVDRMVDDLKDHVPHAVRDAHNDVLFAMRAEVQARVRSGDVVVR